MFTRKMSTWTKCYPCTCPPCMPSLACYAVSPSPSAAAGCRKAESKQQGEKNKGWSNNGGGKLGCCCQRSPVRCKMGAQETQSAHIVTAMSTGDLRRRQRAMSGRRWCRIFRESNPEGSETTLRGCYVLLLSPHAAPPRSDRQAVFRGKYIITRTQSTGIVLSRCCEAIDWVRDPQT